MTTSTVPTPAIFANKKARPVPPPPPAPALIAQIEPEDPGHIVRPGHRDQVVETVHDGVVKTKHLKRGQRVRPFVHGEARGSERIIEKVTRLEDGAFWRVEFASPHPAQDYKAAYRWFDESLVGSTVQHIVKVPALVSYEEV